MALLTNRLQVNDPTDGLNRTNAADDILEIDSNLVLKGDVEI